MVGTLFLFTACSPPNLASWHIQDSHSIKVKIQNLDDWILSSKNDLQDLAPIMSSQIGNYIQSDLRMVDRIEPPFEGMEESLDDLIELKDELVALNRLMVELSAGVDSTNDSTGKSFKKGFIQLNKDIEGTMKSYRKHKKKLIKGFKHDQKKLVFVLDLVQPWQSELYGLKFERKKLEPELARFNVVLNEILFSQDRSTYGKRIKRLSKRIEKAERDLEKFESYLSVVDQLSLKEAKSRILLNPGELKVEKYYIEGREKYLSKLNQIRDWIDSI